MQESKKILSLKIVFIIIVLVLGFNWFFTFQILSLKDDNSFYYMPVRMYLSDALHNHTLPYWNAFIAGGLPQLSDLQGAVWNPIAFVLCYFFKYNHSVFLFEYMLYMLIAAFGIYKLVSTITQNSFSLLLSVVVYIGCGFTSGVANFINWTASLAFLPWMFYFFYAVLQKPNRTKSILLGITCWLLFVCGYPAFIFYAIYVLAALFIWFAFKNHQQKKNLETIISFKFLMAALVIAFLLSLPALLASIEFLPYYSRGKNLETELMYRDCFYPQFLASLLIPTSVYNKNYDVLCHSANRDIYFGIMPLLLSILFISQYKKFKTGFIVLLSCITVFTLIFLFGYLTPLGNIVYHYLPLFSLFKWSSLPRIFIIIAGILTVAYMMEKEIFSNTTIKWAKRISLFLILAWVITFVFTLSTVEFENSHHKTIFWVNSIVQFLLLSFAFWRMDKLLHFKKYLFVFAAIDLFINYTLAMAATGTANVRPYVYNNYCKEFYLQQPEVYLKKPLGQNIATYQFDAWKNHKASKILNGNAFIETNTLFIGYEKLFKDDSSNQQISRNHPFVFSENIDSLEIDKIDIGYSYIYLKVKANKAGNIVLQQNDYYKWKEKNNLPISNWKDCFIQLPVKKGVNEIELNYNKGNYKQWLVLSYIIFMALLVYLLSSRYKILPSQRQPA